MAPRISIVSGGFDPIHPGHITLIRTAAIDGDVVVLLNSDEWLARKKGKPFMSWADRAAVIESIKGVTEVRAVDDSDGSVCRGIADVYTRYANHEITFCNGGDRIATNVPEISLCEALGVQIAWGVGGGKQNSSSGILAAWNTERVERPWGEWMTYRNFTTAKLKELVVQPGEQLSMQRHAKRVELWFVAQGEGEVRLGDNLDRLETIGLSADHDPNFVRTAKQTQGLNTYRVRKGEWHQLKNTGNVPLHIIEIQYGELCIEEDIERVQENN